MSDEDDDYIPNEYEDDYEDDWDDEEKSELSENSLMKGYESVEEDRILTEDFNHLYETNQTFESRDLAIEWVRGVGEPHDMYFVRSTTRPIRTYVKCHRGEKYRQTPTKDGAKPRESSGTMRMECPFQLVVERSSIFSKSWRIRTMEHRGRHNHELGDNKEGYNWPSKIKPDEYEQIRIDTELGLQPSQILGRLKSDPDRPNYSNLQHVYNAREKIKKVKMGSTQPLAYLFQMLAENNWYQRSRPIDGTNRIGDIFFADNRCISLLEQFSQVLLVDATYKTNHWKLPFVQVIGFVPTGQNFHVAFAFVHDEKEASYTWVMQQLDDMLLDFDKPRLFVTDRELASMNAIRTVFPRATNLLCRRHIAEDVQKYLTRKVKAKHKEKDLTSCWEAIVFAKTEEEYELAVNDLDEEFIEYPVFTNYIKETWLDKYHQKFVACWVDQHMHYGTTTTNRVESSHAQLKKEIRSCRDDLPLVWESIKRVVTRQLDTIKGEFEKARAKVPKYAKKGTVLHRLPGKVAPIAIKLMWNQFKTEAQRNNDYCDCILWSSHGLPCKCFILASHNRKDPIDPVDVDIFWRSLHFDGTNRPSKDERRATAEILLDESVRMYKDRHGEIDIKQLAARLREESYPEQQEYESPPAPPRKGRPPKATGTRFKNFLEKGYKGAKKQLFEKNTPKKSARNGKTKKDEVSSNDEWSENDRQTRRVYRKTWNPIPEWILTTHVPRQVREVLTGYHNVRGDGQCGYRSISWLCFGGNQRRYVDVRLECMCEMTMRRDFWYPYFERFPGDFDRVWNKLNFTKQGECDERYFLGGFIMLPLVATRYQKVIVLFARSQSMTFPPLYHKYDEDAVLQLAVPELPEVWYMGFSDSPGHFYVLNAPQDAPKPMLNNFWRRHADANVQHWADLLNCNRM